MNARSAKSNSQLKPFLGIERHHIVIKRNTQYCQSFGKVDKVDSRFCMDSAIFKPYFSACIIIAIQNTHGFPLYLSDP